MVLTNLIAEIQSNSNITKKKPNGARNTIIKILNKHSRLTKLIWKRKRGRTLKLSIANIHHCLKADILVKL